ncbi:hypothetical protein VQ056_32220 [Paenibacillus sp. JTLBN-2024]
MPDSTKAIGDEGMVMILIGIIMILLGLYDAKKPDSGSFVS